MYSPESSWEILFFEEDWSAPVGATNARLGTNAQHHTDPSSPRRAAGGRRTNPCWAAEKTFRCSQYGSRSLGRIGRQYLRGGFVPAIRPWQDTSSRVTPGWRMLPSDIGPYVARFAMLDRATDRHGSQAAAAIQEASKALTTSPRIDGGSSGEPGAREIV